MRVLAKSDIGRAREMNQDSFYVSDVNGPVKLYILADGMGGYKGGEIASSLAVTSAKHYIVNNIQKIKKENENLQFLSDTVPCGFLKYTCEKLPKITYI